MKDLETRWSKIRGLTIALMCLVPLGIVGIAIFLWKTLCVPVIGAFAELGHDFKIIMKGG